MTLVSGASLRSHEPDAVDEGAVADRDHGDGWRGQVAGDHAIGDLDGQRRRAGGDARVVAVDEELHGLGRGVGLGCAASVVEVVTMLDDPRAQGPHPLDLGSIGPGRAEHDGRDAEGPGGIGHALTEVPGD